ncbi:MAG: DUF3048 domain-containing protein, partial [Defluviitaleaceae bacterium]|nr:DUF3048 domain-containing protein [Defluviitaleaceae bacterium]
MKVGLRKLLTAIPLVVILMLALTGVARQIEEVYEPTPTPIPTPVATPRPTPTPVPTPTPIPSSPEGVAVSRLTGLYICEEAARRRPFAVVYNNESRGLPQMGLMQADIIYEVLAEGSITRVIAIFQDFDAEMIGPIRSARHYFTNFALDSGAVFVHHGASTQGYNAIRNLGLDNIDGMRFDGTVFWRDADRRRERGLEHSSFTSAERLMNVAEQLNLDMVAPDYLGMFEFFEEPTAPRPENIANT